MNPPSADLAGLLRGAANGDLAAFQELYRKAAPTAFALALKITGDAADAEDVLVEAFHQVWITARRYDPGKASVTGWILNITRSRAIDAVRARSRRLRRETESAEPGQGWRFPDPETPESRAIRSQEQQALRTVLATLDPDQRKVLELAFYGGLSQSEIARRLNAPLGTVKTRVRLAMKKIRTALGAVVKGEP